MTTYSIPTLQTARLTLRAPKPADLPQLIAFYATERAQMVGGPLTHQEANRAMLTVFGSWALLGHGLFHIVDKTTDAFLGWTGIIYAPDWEEPELAWTVTEAAQGHGIAHEAALAARHHAAVELGLDRVISYIAPTNSRSGALARRLDATHERDSTLRGKPVQVWRHPKAEAA